MTEYLKTKTQESFFDVLSPRLIQAFRDEFNRRQELANENVESFNDAEEVITLIQTRKRQLEAFEKLAELFKGLKEEDQKALDSWTSFRFDDEYKQYVEDREVFLVNFDKTTDTRVKRLKRELSEEEQGIKDISSYRTEKAIKAELKARLAVAPATKYEDIVEKIEKELDINQFFNN